MVEKQVIAIWYTPEEKLPEEDKIVLVTVSGIGHNFSYNRAFALAMWCGPDGWFLTDVELDEFDVHAWCDIEPYGG